MHRRCLLRFVLLSAPWLGVISGCAWWDRPAGRTDKSVIFEPTPAEITCDGVVRVRDDLLAINLEGSAMFFDTSSTVWSGEPRVRLQLYGWYEADVAAGEIVKVTKIVIFGESGNFVTTSDPCDTLLTLPSPNAYWEVPLLDAEWNGTSKFKLIVRHYYDLTVGETVTHHFQDRVGSFHMTKSMHMDTAGMVITDGDATPGDAITTAYASGSFLGAGGLALYDVRVTYDNLATSFEVWAGPVGGPTGSFVLLHTGIGPPPGSWSQGSIEGPYDPAYPNYTITIKHYYRGTLKSSVTGTFIDVAANGAAVFVPIQPH